MLRRIAAARRQSTAAVTTTASAASATAVPGFTFEWKGGEGKPRTFSRPEYLSSPTPKLYKQPTLVLEPTKSKYKYDLNEFIELTKKVKRCQSASELEALVKVTPYRIFNAFSIAEIYLKFHSFVPEARAAGTKKQEGEVESKFVRPSVPCVQHMFLPAMDMDISPRGFGKITSAFVQTETPIPAFVLFKLRWAKSGAFSARDLSQTMYNVAVNMPHKETYEPMLSEMKQFEREVFDKTVALLTKKMQAGTLFYEYQNLPMGQVAFALREYYGGEDDKEPQVQALFQHMRAVFANRSLNSLTSQQLVQLVAAPLLTAEDSQDDAQFTRAIASQVEKRGVAAFALPELEKLAQVFQQGGNNNELLLASIQSEVAVKQQAVATTA